MRFVLSLVVIACLSAGVVTAFAADFPTCGHCRYCGSKICCTKAELAKVKEECWEVECREICIPRVRFPWTKTCETRPGRVRVINVLKAREYEVERCQYRWEIIDLCETCREALGNSETAPPPVPAAAGSKP